MKRSLITQTIGVLTLASLAACQPKNPADPNAPEKKDAAKVASKSSVQPGKITLNGVIAANAKASRGTDGPIAISAQPGSNEQGTPTPLAKENEPVFNDNVPADVVEGLKKPMPVGAAYFGCERKDWEPILGQGAVDGKTLVGGPSAVSAGHVLLCGANPIAAADASVAITAQEITLLDAKLNLKSPASVSIQTLILTVKGTNRISTSPTGEAEDKKPAGEAGTIADLAAGGAITLTVVEKVNIDNSSLVIATRGADQKSPPAK